MNPYFSPAALKFLNGLARHNDRTWFDARKPVYEAELKQPMHALITEINSELERFAPAFIRDPAKIMMRIYRDVRFSKDKRPYKTNLAAWWAMRGMEKTSGAGFYLEISPAAVRVAAGVYMPEKEQLFAIRNMLLEQHETVRAALHVSGIKPPMLPFDGLRMTRGPKGFPTDHPATDLILQRQWGLISNLPAELALKPTLARNIVKRFQLAMPLVELLNEPLSRTSKRPVF